MTDKDYITLKFDIKVRNQLKRIKEKTNAATFAEVVRRALDLLEKEANK